MTIPQVGRTYRWVTGPDGYGRETCDVLATNYGGRVALRWHHGDGHVTCVTPEAFATCAVLVSVAPSDAAAAKVAEREWSKE